MNFQELDKQPKIVFEESSQGHPYNQHNFDRFPREYYPEIVEVDEALNTNNAYWTRILHNLSGESAQKATAQALNLHSWQNTTPYDAFFNATVFTYHDHTKEYALDALSEQFKDPNNSQWIALFEEVTNKDVYSYKDLFFINKFRLLCKRLLEHQQNKGSDNPGINDFYRQNSDLFDINLNVMEIITRGMSQSPVPFIRSINALENLQSKLTSEQLKDLSTLNAKQAMYSLCKTHNGADVSYFDFFHDRGSWSGTGIEVAAHLPDWIPLLQWVLSQFDKDGQQIIINQLGDKIVRDVTNDFDENQEFHSKYWDGEFIAAMVQLMNHTYFSAEMKKNVYTRLPEHYWNANTNSLVLPTDEKPDWKSNSYTLGNPLFNMNMTLQKESGNDISDPITIIQSENESLRLLED